MTIEDFVEESNRIEGITRSPTMAEVTEMIRFMDLPSMSVEELESFVRVYQPGAALRDKPGLDVRVGNHIPMRGQPSLRKHLEELLANNMDAYEKHLAYETLHPFTDGNGRSGRALWAWQMGTYDALRLGFLHMFYYQTLRGIPRR